MVKLRIIFTLFFILILLSFQPFSFGYYYNDNVNNNFLINSTSYVIYNPYENINFNLINQYKTNLHTHTKESDGSSSPEDVIYHYNYFGNYDILSITDHNKNTWPWSNWISEIPLEKSDSSEYYPDLDMLAISGNELSIGHHRGSFLNNFNRGGYFFKLSFWYIKIKKGLSIFNHPGRYNYDDDWYQKYFDYYDDIIIGIEAYNQGDRYSNDRFLWDRINSKREPNNLIWGFSNDDMHHISTHAFRNYQFLLMNYLTEEEFRNSLNQGSFYFCYEPNGSKSENPLYGIAKTPKLTKVIINNNIIELNGENITSIDWYDNNSHIISNSYSIDVSTIDSNFVRAVLKNEYGFSYTQPFGLDKSL